MAGPWAAACLYIYRALAYLCTLCDDGNRKLVDGLECVDDDNAQLLQHVFSPVQRLVLARMGRDILGAFDVLQRAHRHAFGLTASKQLTLVSAPGPGRRCQERGNTHSELRQILPSHCRPC